MGSWRLDGSVPVCELDSDSSASNVLYAFVSNPQVLFIGKTAMTLAARMYGYQNPGPTQRTNQAIHTRIEQYLGGGRSVDIYVLIDTANLEYRGFRASLAAGLDDTLIGAIRPPWNKTGS